MDNQHKQIKGYRDLTQAEIDLMNEIKQHALATRSLVEKVQMQAMGAVTQAQHLGGEDFVSLVSEADPIRWAEAAQTTLQTGYMQLTRAIAMPRGF